MCNNYINIESHMFILLLCNSYFDMKHSLKAKLYILSTLGNFDSIIMYYKHQNK